MCYNLYLERIEKQTEPGEGEHHGGDRRKRVHGGGVGGLGGVGKFSIFLISLILNLNIFLTKSHNYIIPLLTLYPVLVFCPLFLCVNI